MQLILLSTKEIIVSRIAFILTETAINKVDATTMCNNETNSRVTTIHKKFTYDFHLSECASLYLSNEIPGIVWLSGE